MLKLHFIPHKFRTQSPKTKKRSSPKREKSPRREASPEIEAVPKKKAPPKKSLLDIQLTSSDEDDPVRIAEYQLPRYISFGKILEIFRYGSIVLLLISKPCMMMLFQLSTKILYPTRLRQRYKRLRSQSTCYRRLTSPTFQNNLLQRDLTLVDL